MKTLLRAAALLSSGLLLIAADKPIEKTVKLDHSGEARIGGIAPSFGLWGLNGDGPYVLDKIRKTPVPAPLLITFGASWCPPCVEGLPRFKKLAEKRTDFRLVLIDMDRSQADAKAWVAQVGLKSLVLWDKFEVAGKLYGAAGGNKTTLPRTFLVDEKGRVRAIYGIEGADLEAVIEADLKEALEAPGIAGQVPPGSAVPATTKQ